MNRLKNEYKRVTADQREDWLFQAFWVEEQSLSDIAESQGNSRQWISQQLKRSPIKTYHRYRYPPRGIKYRWSFADDTFLLHLAEETLPVREDYQDLVQKLGPVEVAKVLEKYESGDGCEWAETLSQLQSEHHAYPEAWDTLRRHVIKGRDYLWRAVKYSWENWEEALEQDPLPRWVLNRAMDDLGMTQAEFAQVIGFQPRTIRKWTNRGSSSRLCTGPNHRKIYWRLQSYVRDDIDGFLSTYAQVVVDRMSGYFESAYELRALFPGLRHGQNDPLGPANLERQ